MFETLLNFVAGVIFGTIFVLMILFFMMCMLWCRPIPRVPIAKNQPINKIESEVEETVNWLSIFNNNNRFHDWFRLKLTSGIQSQLDDFQNSDEFKLKFKSNDNVNIKVREVNYSNPTFKTVKAVDTIEGTAVSTFPVTFSSNIKILIEVAINVNDTTSKKINFYGILNPTKPVIKVSIPYEKGIIRIYFNPGPNSSLTFDEETVTEEVKDSEKIESKNSDFSEFESQKVNELKELLQENLIQFSLKIDIDTVPVDHQTIDEITETDSKLTEEALKSISSSSDLASKGESSPELPEVKVSPPNPIAETEEKNENYEDEQEEDEDDDVGQIRGKFAVDPEIKEIVDQAASLINDDKSGGSASNVLLNKQQK